ncbi:MAG: Mur ligase family protein, partial [Gemmatimonadaceae bacterium]
MKLGDLLRGIADAPRDGDIVVTGLTQDSRAVRAGDAFVALQGARAHGIQFAPQALASGAVAVLAEKAGDGRRETGDGADVVWIDHLRVHLGEIAARFFDRPSEALTVIGVTGTNGKTSTVQLLAQAFSRLGHRAATIGTLGSGLHGSVLSGERTTPDVISVHALLAEFREARATHVTMEVSSHALDQRRVDAVAFDVAVFTNLTRDHLDYHGTMEAYGAAKARLFAWPGLGAAVINVDDAFGRELAAQFEHHIRHPGHGLAGTQS